MRRPLLTLGVLLLLMTPTIFGVGLPTTQAAAEINRIQGPESAPSIVSSGNIAYPFSAGNANYKAWFKGNSRATNSVRFTARGYNFTMNIATSQLTYYASSLNAIVGMTSPMNPQNTAALVQGNKITYAGAWTNTDLIYQTYGDELKETLVIHGISPPSNQAADYLQYAANCYYNNTLTIYANGVGYLHPTNQRFTTQGIIAFNDPQNRTVFWLPEPYMYDSNGTTAMGTYAVTANNGILVINIRIPRSYLTSAVFPVYLDPPTRVQGNARGTWSSGSSFTVTMDSTPTNGNVIVLAVGIMARPVKTVSSVSQTAVTWTSQGVKSHYDGYYTQRAEIWYGVVAAGAGTTITVNLDGTPNVWGVGDACEYSGMLTASFLDKTATADGTNTPTSTGTTADTTQAAELWIGCSAFSGTHSNPTNSFTLLDGTKVAYLEKIVSSTGAASSGTTVTPNGGWASVIATFKAAAGSTDYPRAASKALTFSNDATTSLGWVRGASKALDYAGNATRILGIIRSVEVINGFRLTDSAGRVVAYARGTSAAFTLASAASKFVGYVRATTGDITFTGDAGRFAELTRGAAEALTFTSAGTRLVGFIRATTQGITFTSATTRFAELVRGASQGFTLTSAATRLIGFLRDTSQGITFSDDASVVVHLLTHYIRGAGQAIAFAADAGRSIGFTRAASEAITFLSTGFGHLVVNFVANVGVAIDFKNWGWGVLNATGGGISYWLIIVGVAALLFFLLSRRR